MAKSQRALEKELADARIEIAVLKELKQLTRKLSQKCAELIRLNFRNIVDGEF